MSERCFTKIGAESGFVRLKVGQLKVEEDGYIRISAKEAAVLGELLIGCAYMAGETKVLERINRDLDDAYRNGLDDETRDYHNSLINDPRYW